MHKYVVRTMYILVFFVSMHILNVMSKPLGLGTPKSPGRKHRTSKTNQIPAKFIPTIEPCLKEQGAQLFHLN